MSQIASFPGLPTRHNVHPFPARMAAHIPLDILSPRRGRLRVLDPMAGSGTSLIVARAAGHSTCGFDSDPLAVLLSKVGTADTKVTQVEAYGRRVLRVARRMRIAGLQAYPSNADEETRKFVRYWFDLESRKQLTALARAIRDVGESSVRKFLWCALSRMIITKDAGVSLARDVSHSRPHRVFANSPVKPFDLFEAALKRVLKACPFRGAQTLPKPRVSRGDARQLSLDAESFDLVITSPPYLNAIDYMRGHKLALVWMGYAVDTLRQIRSDNVGAEREDTELPDVRVESILKAMGRLKNLPESFQRMIQRYVKDIGGVMSEISRVLVPGGKAVIVIGDCTLRGTFIRNSTAVRLLASDKDLVLESERRRRIPDSRRYLPPPQQKSGTALAKRLRTEVVLSFRKS